MSGPDAALAVVGGERITVGDFEAELNRRARNFGMPHATAEQKRALLDELVEFRLLLQTARAAGYNRDPELLARFDELVVGKFREDHLAGHSAGAARVSDGEAREFYQLNQERFATPESVHVAIIYFKSSPKASQEKRAEVKAKAESVFGEARRTDASGFSELARRYSDDQATRYSGGDLGWLTRGDASPAKGSGFEQAAFGIREPGEFAPLVETPEGFYLVRLLGKRAAGVRPFEAVKEGIAYQVARARQQQHQIEFLKEMRRGVKIETNPSLLESLYPAERASDRAPPLPRGEKTVPADKGKDQAAAGAAWGSKASALFRREETETRI